jgi:hypothetical protein
MSDGSPMDDTFAEIIDGRLGNIGVTRNDTSFVNADGETVGSINSAGNFSGNRDVIAALRGTPSLRDMRQAASREAKYGPGSRAAQEGDINTSLLDLVDYAEDGTVQGMGPNRFMDERGRGQLVYDPSAVIPGLPYLQDPQNDVFVPQYDPSRESMAGRALQGVTEYIGDGGMMGAVARGLGGLSDRMSSGVAEDLNPGNFSPMRPVLRPTDGSTTENTGITSAGIRNAIMGGAGSVNKLTSDQLRNLPTYAGGQPFGSLFADQRAAQAARDFASGEGSTFGQMSGTPAYSDDADQLEDLRTTGTVQAPPSQPFGSLFADQRADQAANDFYTGEGSTFGQMSGTPAFDSSVPYSLPPTSDDRNIVPDRMRETALENQALREKGRREGTSIDLLERDYSGIDDVNSNLYDDRFEREESKMFDFNNELQEIIAEYNKRKENQQRANREASLGGADQGVLPSSVSNIVQNPDGSASTGTDGPNIEAVAAAARTDRVSKLNGFNPAGIGEPIARQKATGAENNMPLEQEGPFVERDSRIRDAMAPDGLDDNMYNDGSEIFDLSETYDPSGGGFTGGGGGGSFTGCPEGYEPMTLENGETVCVPIEEEVIEEEVEEVTPVTPTVRPTMGPSAYTPQAVSPIRPYTLQPGEQGVGSLADVLQLQNYPNIV